MPTTSNSPRGKRHDRSTRAGSALLLVLAFVVLLTGLILAFFSRSILEQQVSVSSANQVKVDNFAMDAVAATVSDLKQEVEEGSTPVFPVTGNNYIYYFTPTASSGTYPTMLPAVTGSSTGVPPGSTFGSNKLGQGALLNLVKISLHSQPFYPGTPYDNTETIPKRAPTTLPVSTGSTSDTTGAVASGSADGTSVNGRYISGTRWSKPLFLPSGTVFPMPDWIYVPRSQAGAVANPTTWNANLISAPSNMATATTVVGRYAYAVYDEGGLLDINVAGTPSTMPAASSGYKNSLALADLTQIGLTQAQIDTIVGWRNYASATSSQSAATTTAPTGSVSSGYTWTAANATNYYFNVISNPTGFLRPMSAWSTAPATLTQSDQFFTSRQQLIQFFNTVLGGGTTVQNTLQYLTHFTRSLEQPSYIPPPIGGSGKPATAAIASGGNDLGGGDATVNPALLAARVSTSYTRNDGSTAAIGDPLIKKRFALGRLAWLTYLGPIADDSGNYNTSAGISTLVTSLKSYGYTDAFLRRGGPTNIYKYFGLTWQTDTRSSIGDNQSKWYYNHESSTAPTSISGTAAHIRTLSTGSSNVASLNRDPDFFELLKAATNLGSLGKAYGTTTSAVTNFNATNPIGYQAALDNSTDGSIIQMGVNTIDQFQPSGYCQRILFYDGTFSYPMEFRGIEDLPYLYRVRDGKIMTADSNPAQNTLPTTTVTTLTSAGSGVVLLEPEIWNPHAYNPSNPDTNPRPTSFRVVAISTSPGNASSSASALQLTGSWRWFNTPPNTNFLGSASGNVTLNEANTAMTFNIPSQNLQLFREPTLLIKQGYPSNSSLSSSLLTSSYGKANVTSLYPAAQYPSSVETAQGTTKQYIGMYVGTLPMAWTGSIPVKGLDGTNPATLTAGLIPTGFYTYVSQPTGGGITYRMQYQDASGNWVTYDEKYGDIFTATSYNTAGTFNNYTNHSFYAESATALVADNIVGSDLSILTVDPRTSRFGMIYSGTNGRGASNESFPLGDSNGLPDAGHNPEFLQGWASPVGTGANAAAATQSAILTVRPDENRGMFFTSYDGVALDFGFNSGPSGGTTPQGTGTLLSAYGGWYPIPTVASSIGTSYGSSAAPEPGMFVQNNPAVVNAQYTLRFAGDPQGNSLPFNQFFADADGVIRRGMSAFVPVGSGSGSGSGGAPAIAASTAGVPSGIPTKVMMSYATTTPAEDVNSGDSNDNEYESRPIMLNRPFRSVAELGYVFSGTPWRNVDMSTPESGSAGLTDIFTINDTDDATGLVAGKVNLNTRQPLVIQAILNGAYTDEFNPGSSILSQTYASAIATALTNRTQGTVSGLGPLRNVSDLIGRWNASVATGASVNGSSSFVGFTSDSINSTNTTTAMYDLSQALVKGGSGTGATADANTRVERFRDASVRALVGSGQTRVWNLMIDVIAQTGRFPSTATALTNFYVEGEQRYWVHLAIDRYTGQVIDQQIEEVKE